jgi:Ser/Thr protein kinase RdoA (MazF antagonist)
MTENSILQTVLPAYGIDKEVLKVDSFGSGLINLTWKITTATTQFILQKINNTVFENPGSIAHNINVIEGYLQKHHPQYQYISPLPTNDGSRMFYNESEGYFRLYPFVTGSHSKDVVLHKEEAWEAARQFGRFSRVLAGLDVGQLRVTVPFFHDLSLRYTQFLKAIATGNHERRIEAKDLIDELVWLSDIEKEYRAICKNPSYKLRVTHHDTKISNVLFDDKNEGVCVVDLDTVMPGYFISDLGDMMRTYLSPASEEEPDVSKIIVREEFYKALVEGYYSEMKDELSKEEVQSFFYAGKFMIYMQALRFLTDYLNNDAYYGVKYDGHNLVRARNQLVLLQQMIEKRDRLERHAGIK